MNTLKQVLTIAGSDSGGGAGIQADLKAMSANRVFAMSVITSITAQNTQGVTAVFDLPVSIIERQLDAIFEDFDVAAVKTGMLSSVEIVQAVSRKLNQYGVRTLIVDPVMVAKSGHALLKPEAIETLKTTLIPLALLVTPNIPEAEHLSDQKIRTIADARQAAKAIHKLGCRHVLIKGGHLLEEKGTDLLYDGRYFHIFKTDYIDTPHTHGTGCTFASAIAAQLAHGKPLPEAVQAAKIYLTEAIRHGLAIGRGKGPTNHFYFLGE
jgi:hydroxymethylpyrimidine/phosphomethylpyrimidine kinase